MTTDSDQSQHTASTFYSSDFNSKMSLPPAVQMQEDSDYSNFNLTLDMEDEIFL
jgi:hypothetical protein